MESLVFRKGTSKDLKDNDDFVVRFIATPKNSMKIIYIFIYATYEHITRDLFLNPQNKKEIDDFFQEELEEWKRKTPIDKILKSKYHYLIYGNISRMQAKSHIEKEYFV